MNKQDSAMLSYLLGVLICEVNHSDTEEEQRLEMLDAITKIQSYLYNEYENEKKELC